MSRHPRLLVACLLQSRLGFAIANRAAARGLSSAMVNGSEHTAKWMTKIGESKSPQDLINEVAPIEVRAPVVACEGSRDPALGHPVEYISLVLGDPATCKYCGLRYVQQAHHQHHH